MLLALGTFLLGAVIGWLGQRSRMCFIGGFRDYLLVRDKALIKGVLAFFFAAWLCLKAAAALRGEAAVSPQPALDAALLTGAFALSSLVGGFILGLATTLSDACPFRHHVLAGQGRLDSVWFIGGMAAGVILFYVLAPKWSFL